MHTINLSQETIKVLIVDDQKLVRKTLQLYLESQSNIEVVGYAESGVVALEKIAALKPDIAIVDLEMPGMSGITTIEIIRDCHIETKVLVLSSYDEKEYINQAITAGARGYLLKGTKPEELITAIEQIYQGYFQLGSGLLNKLNLDSYGKTVIEEDLIFEEADIPLIPTQVETTEEECTEYVGAETTDEFVKMRRELVEIIEFKLHVAEEKKSLIQEKYLQLQQKVSWLVATQVVLCLMVIGCTSSLVKMKLEVAQNQQFLNLTNIVQPIR